MRCTRCLARKLGLRRGGSNATASAQEAGVRQRSRARSLPKKAKPKNNHKSKRPTPDSNAAKEPPNLARRVSRKPTVLRRILLSVGVPGQQSSMTGEADPGGLRHSAFHCAT